MLNEKDLQFFKPIWRRVIVACMLTGWTAVEWLTGNSFWGTLTSALLVYFTWAFMVNYPRLATVSKKKIS